MSDDPHPRPPREMELFAAQVRAQIAEDLGRLRVELEQLRTQVISQMADGGQSLALIAANQKRIIDDLLQQERRITLLEDRQHETDKTLVAAGARVGVGTWVLNWLGPAGLAAVIFVLYEVISTNA